MSEEKDINSKPPEEATLRLEGKAPTEEVLPKSQAYDDLQKKIIDVLVDAIKYIASSCAITIALYSQILQGYLRDKTFVPTPMAKALLLAPLLLWLCVIISTIAGIFPRTYNAYNDYDKQEAVKRINKTKTNWLIVSLVFFFSGFTIFIYIMYAQIWNSFPFHK